MSETTIAAVSDMHAGSTVALCPPRVELDDGGAYVASKSQLWLWQSWHDYWEQVDRERRDKLYIVLNGDLVDGDHHNTPQILSRNPTAQAMVLDAALSVPLALGPDAIFIVRGTASHVGQSGSSEERIASGLRKDGRPIVGCPDTGTDSWFHLRLEAEGVRFDIAHHGRTGHREHTRQNAANLYAHDILLSYVKDGDPPPHLCIRSHNHKWLDSHDAARVLRVIGLPAWQLATGYVHAKIPDSVADIGGLIVQARDGQYETSKVHFKPERGATWKES